MNRKKYNELLIKNYEENHSFIEKAVFTVTNAVIGFLLLYSEKINQECMIFYAVCVAFFYYHINSSTIFGADISRGL